MSVEIIEGATAAAFGAADAAISSKVTQKLPGNLSMAFGFELAGVATGMFGKSVGLGREITDPVFISALTLLGARASRLAMAGTLFNPSAWGAGGDGVGGDGGGDGHAIPMSAPAVSRVYQGARNAPGVRMLGPRGSSFGLYPLTNEQAGVAG